MGRPGPTGRRALIAAALCALPTPLVAQGSEASRAPLPAIDSVTVAAGGRYQAGALHRFWLGDGWRNVWMTEITVPVLDIHSFAGGLEFDEQGGGNQSITLHMTAADGNEYLFRSVDKHPGVAMPPDLLNTPTADVVQDYISALHPGAGLVVAQLLESTRILHLTPRLVVMPDDPALGEFRETFAGMLGTLEEKANEGPDDTPGWGGSRKVVGMDRLLEHMEESPDHRIDAQEFLLARLFDIVVGDTDRAEDQWRAARYDAEDGGYVYRPIPRDRDWAFVSGTGVLLKVGRSIYPKLIPWGPDLPNVRAATIQAWRLDRPLLVGLEWPAWQEAVRELQASLTDEAIVDAMRVLPPEWAAVSGDELVAGITGRRDGLMSFAREYYLLLAKEPEIHATDAGDRVEVIRHEDGDVEVRLAAADADRTYLTRRFESHETTEVRLHLHGGDDVALVRGTAAWDAPMVRIRGGGGDDALIDESTTRGRDAATAFYDDRGDNELVGRGPTIIDTRAYEAPEESQGAFATLSGKGYRDWGSSFGWSPVLEYGGGHGLLVGGGPTYTHYGYRRDPYHYRIGLGAMFSFRNNRFGAQLDGDYRLANSPVHFELLARGTRFEGFRYFGLGNDPEDAPLVDDERSFVELDEVRVRMLVALDLPDNVRLAAGPSLVYSDPRPHPDGPFAADAAGLRGAEGFGRIGARLEASIDQRPGADPRSGFALDLALEGYPTAWDVTEDFAIGQAVARAYLDIPIGMHPKVALRLGGRRAWGDWPILEGAFIGGLETVRGYRYNRFVGEQAAWGNVELRVPLFQLTLLSRGRVGVIGLADAGRVWLDGTEAGADDWHTAYGGGLSYETLGRAFSVLYAHGEEDRWYLQVGMPF